MDSVLAGRSADRDLTKLGAHGASGVIIGVLVVIAVLEWLVGDVGDHL